MEQTPGPSARENIKQLVLPESLDLRAAAPLASTLLFARGEGLIVDASKVVTIGAQCLQVLLSAKLTWLRDGQCFMITNPSDAFLGSLHDAGLAAHNLMEGDIDI